MRLVFLLLLCSVCRGQGVTKKLEEALGRLEADSQFRHASISLYVVDTRTGRVVLGKNPETGLAPASCQKVITAATAFEILGKDYAYTTRLGYNGRIDSGILNGNIFIVGSGDPTLGSSHYSSTRESQVLEDFKNAVRAKGIRRLKGLVLADDKIWGTQRIPDGWIWQDMGNYYGAGAAGLNWRENEYELILKSGKHLGDPVKIVGTRPKYLPGIHLMNELTSADKESGDNAYIYMAPDTETGFIRGTIPIEKDSFIISGSLPDGGRTLAATLFQSLAPGRAYPDNLVNYLKTKAGWPHADSFFYSHHSPPVDSIMYWFLKRSINLYGEALLKTIAYESRRPGTTDDGVEVVNSFWEKRGIGRSSLKIIDGSGLSPANRITTASLVSVLQYAKDKNWFSSFYHALPEINGIKMKDGYINGVRSYAGYVNGSAGEYTFAFIVNNFDGSPSAVRQKMWKVLDILK